MAGTLSTDVSSRLAAALSPRVVGAAVRTVYPRIEPELARLASYAPTGGTALDIGAWYGPWTRGLRRLADRVVAVEPTPELARCVAAAYPQVRVVQAVASDTTGTAVLYVPAGGPGIGTSSVESGDGVPLTVERITVDSLGLTDVRFVKLDVEGHELPALHGAAQTIQRDGPMLMVELEERMQPIEPVLTLLEGWGYRPYVMPERDWVPLSEFDLIAHQREAAERVTQSFVRRVVDPRPRYVNMVLFRREEPSR